MMFNRKAISVLTLMAAAISTSCFAKASPIQYQPNPDSPIGIRNIGAPPELRQLEFLIVDWKAAVVLHQPNGDLAYEACWHNSWIVNRFAIMQEW